MAHNYTPIKTMTEEMFLIAWPANFNVRHKSEQQAKMTKVFHSSKDR